MTSPDDPFTTPTPAPAALVAAGGSSNGVAVAALVVGILALITGLTILGGLVLGPAAVALGLVGRARARTAGRGLGPAVAAVVLGVLGVLLAAGAYLYVRDEVGRYQDCTKASLSIAEDQRCRVQLERDLGVRS